MCPSPINDTVKIARNASPKGYVNDEGSINRAVVCVDESSKLLSPTPDIAIIPSVVNASGSNFDRLE